MSRTLEQMDAELKLVAKQFREGTLVPAGGLRDMSISIGERGNAPEPGDIQPGPFIVISVEPTDDPSIWHAKVRVLVAATSG